MKSLDKVAADLEAYARGTDADGYVIGVTGEMLDEAASSVLQSTRRGHTVYYDGAAGEHETLEAALLELCGCIATNPTKRGFIKRHWDQRVVLTYNEGVK